MYPAKDIVTSEEEIRAVIPGQREAQMTKFIDHVDALVADWIARSTFLAMATFDGAGRVDVSPKGDPAGFVKGLDDKTLAIPDRPGNHRFDGFLNILETGRIGLVFLVPNRNEVVRINGSARIVRDEDIRALGAIKGRVPEFVILVDVEEAFFHCGKAIIRSRLWFPDDAGSIEGLPTYAEALKAHADISPPMEELEERLRHNDLNRLYDE